MPATQTSVRQLRGETARNGVVVALVETAAAFLCLRADRHAAGVDRFWLCAGIVLLVFAADRLLGLLGMASRAARQFLKSADWYWPYRRPIQFTSTLIIAFAAIIVLARPRWIVPDLSVPRVLSWYALVLLAAFILLRSISLHELDGLLYRRRRFIPTMPLNMLTEITLATMVAICSIIAG